jgi:PiT family inorganic phosphate transporter
MGLIMLILIGTVPTAYALNRAVRVKETQDFVAVSKQTADTLSTYVSSSAVIGDPRDDVTDYIRTRQFKPTTLLALRQLVNEIGDEMVIFRDLSRVPADKVRNFRNDMYVVSEALRLMQKSGQPQFTATDAATLSNYKKHIDNATKFIPTLGEGRRGHRLGPWHHGGLEADRRHGR